MSDTDLAELEARLDPRDLEYVASLEDAEKRATIVSTIARYQHADRLHVGDRVPPLQLFRPEGAIAVPLETLIGERPLVLVFGSYTWPPFRRRSGDIEALHQSFQDRASFAFVYIAEAHAVNEWQTDSNDAEGILVQQHATLTERIAAALEGAHRLKLTMPILVDGMANAVGEAFAAWPERIYIVGTDGRIAFKGGPGPWEFDPDAARVALEELLR